MTTRLSAYIAIATAALLALVAPACAETDIDVPGTIVEGRAVEALVPFEVGGMPSVSRADMAAGRDTEINSVWLGFFTPDGKLAYKFSYSNQPAIGVPDVDFNGLKVELLSGRYYLAAVANPEGHYGVNSKGTVADLPSMLDAVETYDDYADIAMTHDAGIITTPAGNLAMQGVWVPDGTDHAAMTTSQGVYDLSRQLVPVPFLGDGVHTLTGGKIHFRRLTSQVKLNLRYDTDNIVDFTPVSIQVYNVPSLSWIAERGDDTPATANAGDVLTAHIADGSDPAFTGNYSPSPLAYTMAHQDGSNLYQYDWYQLENRRTGQCTAYHNRELEEKNADGSNTGTYTALAYPGAPAANNLATFVTIKVRMSMKRVGTMPDTTTPGIERTVEATYTVHLGFCEGDDEATKAADFNCRRNTRYTYNINISDVDKIEVEARKEPGDYQHGAEGIVTVLSERTMTADAHYSVHNVQFTDDERRTLTWRMRVYTSQNDFYDITNGTYQADGTITGSNYEQYNNIYYDWVEFRPTTGRDVIAAYSPSQVFPLNEINDVAKHPGHRNGRGWYTMFIKEYVYETDQNSTANWKKYVNLPDRSVWLKVQERRSDDGESIIIGSKYALSQHSIQTYYGTGASDPSMAIGVEHTNELEGLKMSYHYHTNLTTGVKSDDGRYVTWDYLGWLTSSGNGNKRWNNYLHGSTLTIDGVLQGVENYYFGSSTSDYRTILGCLNRNRDLNGNGTIEANEVRWFVPGIQQYVDAVMGAQALPSPIYNFSDYPEGSVVDGHEKHFAAIDQNMLWAEEGMSTGGLSNPQHIRCMRHLGIDMNTMPANPGQPAFNQRGTSNIIEFHLAPENYRSTTATALPPHTITDDFNRTARAFEYKTATADDIDVAAWFSANFPDEEYTIANYFKALETKNPCDRFNTGGQRGWRVPNQTEITTMLFTGANAAQAKSYLASCTRSYFLHPKGGGNGPAYQLRIMGIVSDHATAINPTYLNNMAIRCVRDVQ